MCFCRHFYKDHKNNAFSKKTNTSCEFCPCKKFAFVPQRPEEVGEWWLPRRKDFDINKWRAKCKSKKIKIIKISIYFWKNFWTSVY